MQEQKINSIMIVGITGGIGYELFRCLKNIPMKIVGVYCSNEHLANELARNELLDLHQIDLSIQNNFDEILLPDCEALVYVPGIPHFSEDVFQFETRNLQEQININVYSLLGLIKRLVNKPDSSFKKIVIISSQTDKTLNSIYHLFKLLQEEMLKKLLPILSANDISVSIIKANWIDTTMYRQFLSQKVKEGNTLMSREISLLKPREVVEVCLTELNNCFPITEINLTQDFIS